MSNYVIRRLAQSIPLILGISILIFLMLQMTPGGPLAAAQDTGRVTQEALERMRSEYGLNDPLYIQYLHWLMNFVHGDWGISFNTGRPVLPMIMERLPITLLIAGLAFFLVLVIGVPIGILASVRQHTLFDYVTTTLAFLGITIPSFWLGLLLLYVFTFSLHWLPSAGLTDARQQNEGLSLLVDWVRHLLMPVIVLSMVQVASLTRYVRSAVLDVIGKDYVRTARGKGLAERTIMWKHVFKNAAVPIVTILALRIPDLFLGSVVTETIFALPGMGRLFIESANLRDYPVLMGILVIGSGLFIFSNLVADLLYGVLDPRIAYE
jgi:peptide/nickel transport system permease protein